MPGVTTDADRLALVREAARSQYPRGNGVTYFEIVGALEKLLTLVARLTDEADDPVGFRRDADALVNRIVAEQDAWRRSWSPLRDLPDEDFDPLRDHILNFMRAVNRPIDAQELIFNARTLGPTVRRGDVMAMVRMLVDLGDVHEVGLKDGDGPMQWVAANE
jgi:hypothetical protein